MNKTTLVLIDNKRATLVRLVQGEATDVIGFPPDILFTEDEIEMFREQPVCFKAEYA